MYKLSVPVMLSKRFRKEETLQELQRAGAQRVFLALDTISFNPAKRQEILDLLAVNVPYFQENGLEVGIWFWTFGRSNPEYDIRNCTHQMNHLGQELPGYYCPSSPGFLEDVTDFFTEIAKLGPDLIQFDDDFRIPSNDSSTGCFCKHHMARMQEILGEELSREEIFNRAYAGGPNRYREAIAKATGGSMEEFSAAVRKAVDAVNPAIRISLCSCMPTWDYNGTDSIRITKLLAGSTKPIMRLIGAPYWSNQQFWGNRLHAVIELSRMESSWCDDQGIELMSEGDVYPRPRYRVPAAVLENFDSALRFSGETDGILKYMLDYVSSPGYETGYIDRHVRHLPVLNALRNDFAEMTSLGVRVYSPMRKFAQSDMTDIPEPHRYGWNTFFSQASQFLADNAIPSTYRGTGLCGIAFGENARQLPPEALDHGLIIDGRAAKILMEQGIDVGLESVGIPGKTDNLIYSAEDEYMISGYGDRSVFDIVPKADAEVLVWSTTRWDSNTERNWDGSAVNKNDDIRYPDTIRYTNAKGQKFLVFAFDAAFTNSIRWRSYSMQRLLVDSIAWLSGKPLPAVCTGHPDLYIQCKEAPGTLAVGLWNLFPDEIPTPVITLNKSYRHITFLNCDGKLEGTKVTLTQLNPYDFGAFTVTE